jgi:NifU-like protein
MTQTVRDSAADSTSTSGVQAGEGERKPLAEGERKYSRKIESLAANPRHRGAFFTEDATAKDLALVTAKYKDIKVYWLVDPQTDLIYDAKFFSYGGPVSMAMGEILCSLVRGMKFDTACDTSVEEIDNLLRDEAGVPATAQAPDVAFANLPMLLDTARETYPSTKALALASSQLRQQVAQNKGPVRSAYESLTEADNAWLAKPKEKQLEEIELLLNSDIRPGLNMDGGDLQVLDLEDGRKLSVRYEGACGSCGSSVGATLAFIEDTMRRQLFGGMQVTPYNVPDDPANAPLQGGQPVNRGGW